MRSAADIDEVGCPEPAPRARADAVGPAAAGRARATAPNPQSPGRSVASPLTSSAESPSPNGYHPTTPPARSGNGPATCFRAARRKRHAGFVKIPGRAGNTGPAVLPRRVRLGEREKYGSGGSQDVAGALRGGERRGGAREPAARASRRGVREEEGGHDLRFRGPRRQDGQTHRPLSRRTALSSRTTSRGRPWTGGRATSPFLARPSGRSSRRPPPTSRTWRRSTSSTPTRAPTPLQPQRPGGHRARLAGPFRPAALQAPLQGEIDAFEPDWTVISVPGLLTDPEEDGTESETFVGIDFARKVVLVCGTAYAGEIKKSIFTVLNFVLPTERDVFPMHCSANVGTSWRMGERRPLLRALGHGQDDALRRPGAGSDRGRRARLVRLRASSTSRAAATRRP